MRVRMLLEGRTGADRLKLALADDKPHYTVSIFLLFLTVFILKLIGMIVHIPRIENDRKWHNFICVIISVLVIFLNAVTLKAINAGWILFTAGVSVSLVLCAAYIRNLFTGVDCIGDSLHAHPLRLSHSRHAPRFMDMPDGIEPPLDCPFARAVSPQARVP